jgi:fumarate reductase subunit C
LDSYIIESNKKKSRIPARLDFLQSGTGLILGLFMWAHMFLVGSIILGKGFFNFVSKILELSFLSDTGHGFPIAVFFAVLTIFTIFIIHALLGGRKFPVSWKQHRILRDQMQMMDHSETTLWYIQVVTGFFIFFLGSVHLYIMLTHPGSIDPYLSADRIISGNMWPLYLVLLVCVVLHGNIGLYRLCMKWGWFAGKDARKSRKTLKALKNKLTIFFMTLGILALLVFVVIGINHRDKVGERYNKHEPAVEQAQSVDVIQAEEQVPVGEHVQVEEQVPVEEQVQIKEQVPVEEHVQADEEIPAEGHEPEEAQPADVTHQ